MYVKLVNNKVFEIIPDEDPVFPGVDISQRYPADFVSELIHVSDDTDVAQNYIYDPETNTFKIPESVIAEDQPKPVKTIFKDESLTEADFEQMLLDHEYKLTLLELGITGETDNDIQNS